MITLNEINRLDNISLSEVEEIIAEYENLRMEISRELPELPLQIDYDNAAYIVGTRYLDSKTQAKIHVIAKQMADEAKKFWGGDLK